MRSSRANPIVYNDSDGVIKDQQIANLSIENADWAPIIAFWIKEKMPVCLYSTGNNGSEKAGTCEEVIVIFKAIMITHLTKHRGIGLHSASTYPMSLHPYHEWEWGSCYIQCRWGTCFSGRLGDLPQIAYLWELGLELGFSDAKPSVLFTTAGFEPCYYRCTPLDQWHQCHLRAC